MKKKIGFIDLFIDEWHANHYPAMFRADPLFENFELGYAFEKENQGGRNLKEWCREYGMLPASSIEEVVEKSDVLCVLAPSNPEVHEELVASALESGKPTYLDKPFAPTFAAAERIFAKAKEFHAPLMTSSALRFGKEILEEKKHFSGSASFVSVNGMGRSFEEYGIHIVEMAVSLLGCGATGVKKLCQSPSGTAFQVMYGDERTAFLHYHPLMDYTITAANGECAHTFGASTDIFKNLISAMLKFYLTGISPVPEKETLEVIRILEECVALLKK